MAKRKPSPEIIASSWDPEAFQQQVNGVSKWSKTSANRKAKRFQDLALITLDTPPTSPVLNTADEPSWWPFESSPCRMFGGKNARAAEEVGSNNNSNNDFAFDAKFDDHQVSKRLVSDADYDEETSIEDESEEARLDESDDDSDCSSGNGNNLSNEVEPAEHSVAQHRQRTAATLFLQQEHRSNSPGKGKEGARQTSPGKGSNTKHTANEARIKSVSPVSAGTDKKNRISKAKKDAATIAPVKPTTKGDKKQSPAKKSEKPIIGTGTDKTARRKLDKPMKSQSANLEGLSFSSHHVSSTSQNGSAPVRRGINRARSSDGMEGLAAAASENTWIPKAGCKTGGCSPETVRTSASLGNKQRSSTNPLGGSQHKPALDRRSKFARAMSTCNVKRPEEYAHHEIIPENKGPSSRKTPKRTSSDRDDSVPSRAESATTAKVETSKSEIMADKRKASKNPSSASVALKESSHGAGKAQTQPDDAAAVEESVTKSAVVDDGEQQRSSSTLRRKRSTTRGGRSSSTLKSSQHDAGGRSSSALKSSQQDCDGKTVSGNTVVSSESTQRQSKRSSRERRDLMVLLREKKSIQPWDLLDKENRKLLHFLMYEHKMGISQKELQQRIRQEQESS